MTIGNALNFIRKGLKDAALRRCLNAAPTADQREAILISQSLKFTASEFEEAFYHRLTQCQEEEEADQIKEFKMWWDLLSLDPNPGPGAAACSGCRRS